MTNGNAVERIRDIAGSVMAPAAAAHDQAGDWPGSSIVALADAGMLGLTVPKEHGGLGAGPTEFVAVVEESLSKLTQAQPDGLARPSKLAPNS